MIKNIEQIKKHWLYSFVFYFGLITFVFFSTLYIFYVNYALYNIDIIFHKSIILVLIGYLFEVLVLISNYYFLYKNKRHFFSKLMYYALYGNLCRQVLFFIASREFYVVDIISMIVITFYVFNCHRLYFINEDAEKEKYDKNSANINANKSRMYYWLYGGLIVIGLFIIFICKYSQRKVNIQTQQEQATFQFFSKSEIDYINRAYQEGFDRNAVMLSISDIFQKCKEAVDKNDEHLFFLLSLQLQRIEDMLINPFIDGVFDTSDLNDLRSKIIYCFKSDAVYDSNISIQKVNNSLDLRDAFFKYIKAYQCNPVRKCLYLEYINNGSSGCFRFVDSLLKNPEGRNLYKDFCNYDLLINFLLECSKCDNVELFKEIAKDALEGSLLLHGEDNSSELMQAYINEVSDEPEGREKIIEYISTMCSNKKRYAEILCKYAENMPDFSYAASFEYPEIKEFLSGVDI